MSAEQTGQLDAEIAGQKFKYNGPLNTLFTVIGVFLTGLTLYVVFQHTGDTREANVALVAALKEQTQALRENTCVTTYRGPVEDRAEFCKRTAR